MGLTTPSLKKPFVTETATETNMETIVGRVPESPPETFMNDSNQSRNYGLTAKNKTSNWILERSDTL